MNDHLDVIENLYGNRYKGNWLWENVVKNLTVRQAYVFYYSLAFHEKRKVATALGIFDLPAKNEVHRCLMDALQKEDKPTEVARIIVDNVHKILINDNDLLWFKTDLRAALWLSYFVTKLDRGGDKLLVDLLRSTNKIEFINRLIQVLDIYGCSLRGDTAELISMIFTTGQNYLPVNPKILFNHYRGDYVKNRIHDYKLNWLNELSENEVDSIIERFHKDEILFIDKAFVPINKSDKIEFIKAALDLQNYRHRIDVNNAALLNSHANHDVSNIIASSNAESMSEDRKEIENKKKDLKTLDADQIIDLLKKARRAREHRKAGSNTKNDRSLMLNKEAYSTIVKLSEQLNATPKKIVEALIKNVNLENAYDTSEIGKLISGRRSTEKKPLLEKFIESEELLKLEEAIEPKEIADFKRLGKPEEPFKSEESVKVEEATKDLEQKPEQTNKRKRQRDVLLNLKKR